MTPLDNKCMHMMSMVTPLGLGLFALLVAIAQASIDREAVVARHALRLETGGHVDPVASAWDALTVGNGEFAFSVDLTGLQIAEEYRAAIEQKQIAEQQLLRAQTEVKIAEQEALRYDTLNRSLDDQVLYKLFLDKWDGQTEVVPALPGSAGGTPPVIVGRRS